MAHAPEYRERRIQPTVSTAAIRSSGNRGFRQRRCQAGNMAAPKGTSACGAPSWKRVHSVKQRTRPPVGFHGVSQGLSHKMQGCSPCLSWLPRGKRYWRCSLALYFLFRKAKFPLGIQQNAESSYWLGETIGEERSQEGKITKGEG